MDPELRTRAESRLAAAIEASGIADPRPSYREKLKLLRQEGPDAFDGAVKHYEEKVLPALVDGDPLRVWIEYGRYLAGLTATGSAVSVDAQGRARPWAADVAVTGTRGGVPPGASGDAADLVLFMPEDTAAEVMVLCRPLQPSDAQQATLTLLVDRKLSLPG